MTSTHPWTAALLSLALAVAVGACGDGHDHSEHAGPGDHDGAAEAEEAHAHSAPHGGVLVALQDEFAHLEFALDGETGKLTAWCLSSHAVQPVRVAAETIVLSLRVGESSFDLELAAVPSELTGETVGDTSEFQGTDERLVGVSAFEGTIRSLTLKGASFSDVGFRYP